MIKTGLTTLDALARHDPTRFLDARRIAAIALYDEAGRSGRPDRERLMEYALLNFAACNGLYKRTYAGRFGDFDDRVAAALAARDAAEPAPGRVWRIHDVGVSDGRTARDLYRRLERVAGLRFDYLASDVCAEVTVVRRPGGRASLALDARGDLLQIVVPPFVLAPPAPDRWLLYPLNRLALEILRGAWAPRLLRAWRRRPADFEERRVRLVHPDCAELERTRPNFRFAQADLFESPPAAFDLARVMNVLNRGYFSDDRLRQAARRLRDSLTEGGLLATGQNAGPDSPVDGAIHAREGEWMVEIERIGAGSPIGEFLAELGR